MENMLNEEFDNVIILNDEEGNSVPFEFLDLMEYDNEEYVILLPLGDSQSGEVVILKVDEVDDDTEAYTSVNDEETLNTLFEMFKEKFKEEFNFV